MFVQTWRDGDGPFSVEYRDGAPERHFRAESDDTERVVGLFLDWARGGAAWRTALDWQPADLYSTPGLDTKTRAAAEERARKDICSGFWDFHEVAQGVCEAFGPEDPQVSLDEARRIVGGLWEERLAEQAEWPAVTDADRVEQAFEALDARGLTARMNFSCCSNCALGEIAAERGEGDRGFVFFHFQDTESAVQGHGLSVRYGAYADAGEASRRTGPASDGPWWRRSPRRACRRSGTAIRTGSSRSPRWTGARDCRGRGPEMPGTASRRKASGRLSRAVPRALPISLSRGLPTALSRGLPAAVPRVLRTTAPRGLPAGVPWAASLYVGAVQLGAYATARLPGRRRTELLRTHSTNVDNLRAGRWQTLATSAAFVEEPLPVAYGAALLAALGTAEARWGVWRAAGVFAAGHAGASLLVYGALRRRTREGALRRHHRGLPRRLRRPRHRGNRCGAAGHHRTGHRRRSELRLQRHRGRPRRDRPAPRLAGRGDGRSAGAGRTPRTAPRADVHRRRASGSARDRGGAGDGDAGRHGDAGGGGRTNGGELADPGA